MTGRCRMPRAAARCATTARDILSIALSGFVAFCAGGAMIAYVVGTSIPGRLAAASVAAVVFLADTAASSWRPFTRWLFSHAKRSA